MRFSLTSLLAAVFAAAVVCTVFFASPAWVASTVFIICLLFAPPLLIAGIIYFRGFWRAFCIGCVCAGGCAPLIYYSLLLMILGEGEMFGVAVETDEEVGAKLVFAVAFAFTSFSGFVSVGVRWLALQMQPEEKVPRTVATLPYGVLQTRITAAPPVNRARESGDGLSAGEAE